MRSKSGFKLSNAHRQNEAIEMETSGKAIKALPSSTYAQGRGFIVSWEHL
jgi:hypothetical protein